MPNPRILFSLPLLALSLTRWCERQFRAHLHRDSALGRSRSTRARRKMWRRWGSRWGWVGPFRRNRRRVSCSSRWRNRQTSTRQFAACHWREGRLEKGHKDDSSIESNSSERNDPESLFGCSSVKSPISMNVFLSYNLWCKKTNKETS